MNKRKLNWTCSYCSKILKDPIILPCHDCVCGEHLLEKKTKQTCGKCSQIFPLKDNQFPSNETLKILINDQSYLNEEEIGLKREIEASIGEQFKLYDELIKKQHTIVSSHF
jgi:hypothetical protein